MPDRLSHSLASSSVIARVPGSQSLVEVRFSGGLITGVDDIIDPKLDPSSFPFLSPGFIDLQVNGFAGVDYNSPENSPQAVLESLRVMASTGVSRCYPTVITGSPERMTGAIVNLAETRKQAEANADPLGHMLAGLHIEGPHLSGEDGPRGAHPIQHIRPPDPAEFDRWQELSDGFVRLVTISPEWESAPAYTRHVVRSGAVVSVGHTKANRDQIVAVIDAGATMSTHLGNAAHPTLPKTENYIWNQLADDRLTASFIVDGIHVPPDFLRSAIRAKGVERSVLVTDAVMPAMCPPGPYSLGEVPVELRHDGSVVLRGGSRLAGSALRMDHATGNAMRMAGVSLRQALAMATVNAARAGRVAGRQRGLAPGEKADFVLFTWEDNQQCPYVESTIVAGHVIYTASAATAIV